MAQWLCPFWDGSQLVHLPPLPSVGAFFPLLTRSLTHTDRFGHSRQWGPQSSAVSDCLGRVGSGGRWHGDEVANPGPKDHEATDEILAVSWGDKGETDARPH